MTNRDLEEITALVIRFGNDRQEEAWESICQWINERRKTSHNKQSTPCYFCLETNGHKSDCYIIKVAEERETW